MGAPGATLFGKLPWALDFVRINHARPAAVALDAWLQAGVQQLALAGAAWPAERLRFLSFARTDGAVLAGVVEPSRDRAGRKSPVALFGLLAAAPFLGRFAALPSFVDPFLDAAEHLLGEVGALGRDGTREAVERLSLPSLGTLPAAAAACRDVLERESARSLAKILFPEAAEPLLLRACATLLRHAHALRQSPPERALVLDCPIREPRHVGVWLSLAQHVLCWRDSVPSVFWSARERDEPRMLLVLGPPPASLPLWLAQRDRRRDRLVSLAAETDGTRGPRGLEDLRGEGFDLPLSQFLARLAKLWLDDDPR